MVLNVANRQNQFTLIEEIIGHGGAQTVVFLAL